MTVEQLRAQPVGAPFSRPTESEDAAWPKGNAKLLAPPTALVDSDALDAAVDFAFDQPDGEQNWGTRALIVAYDGDHAEGKKAIEPFSKFATPMADLVAPIRYCKLQQLIDEQTRVIPNKPVDQLNGPPATPMHVLPPASAA